MAYESVFSIVRKKWGSIFLSGLLAGSLAFFSLVFFSKHFKVTTDFLVVQTGAGQSQDFYSMLKSSEYLGKVLAESVQSEKFIGAVVETGGVDGNFLPGNPKDRLDAWEKMVRVANNPDVGTLHIEVYDNSDRNALRVAQAVGQVLTEKNSLFRSGDEKSVEIRTLSGPIVEKNPDVRTLPLVFLSGLIFGMLLRFSWVFVKESNALNAVEEEARTSLSAKKLGEHAKNSPQGTLALPTPPSGLGSDRITFNDW
ncbi:MAG: hypothetical protein IPK84_05210 [Candidatus Moraniibacteriota bacterium]|nr:MAG: hypothetical protein IPK84_05210 [Candidatus Moranbacteria bacterium]